MDTEGAFGFLRQAAPLLSGAGFGVLLPDWARKSRLGLKLTTRSRQTSGRIGDRPEVRLGRPGRLPLRPGHRRSGAGPGGTGRAGQAQGPAGPAARPVGGTRRAGTSARRCASWSASRSGTMRASDALQAGLHGPTTISRWSRWTPTAGWATCSPARPTAASNRSPPRPASTASCAPTRSAGWHGCPSSAVSASAAFWPTTWASARRRRRCAWLTSEDGVRDTGGTGRGRSAAPTLVVCPMSVVGNWEREAARFTPELTVHVHHGSDRLRGDDLTGALPGPTW